MDVVTRDGSVAADEGDYAAGRVANAADSVAAAQGTGANIGDSNCHASAAAVQLPPGPTAAAVQPSRGETAVIPPLTATSPAATLPKITNGKRMAPLPKALTVLPENASLSFDNLVFFCLTTLSRIAVTTSEVGHAVSLFVAEVCKPLRF